MGLSKHTQIFTKPWFASTPQNAKKASATLTISGVVSDGQKVTIGSNVYEFDTNNNITSGSIKVDIANLRNQATGTLTFTGAAVAAETVTIGGTEVYEFCVESPGEGNIGVVLGADLSADNAVTKLAEAINVNSALVTAQADTENDNVVLTAIARGTAGNAITTTETCTNAGFADGNLGGGLDTITAANAVTALVSAITANDEYVDAADGDNDTVVVSYKWVGTAGNDIAVSETLTNGTWGAGVTKLSGGQFATPAKCPCLIEISGTIYGTYKAGDKYTENLWYSATLTLV
jgi:hypothetical protein